MNIIVKAVDIKVTEAIENYANKKVGEALEKFVSPNKRKGVLAEVELSKTNNHHSNGDMYKASIKVYGLHRNIFAQDVQDDLYAAIDGLKDRLSEVLSNTKAKKISISHRLAIKFKNIFKNGEE